MFNKLTLVALVFFSGSIHAALISIDYLTPGDNLITLDTSTNLEWLDLTVTQGMSADAVEASSLITSQGFRYAEFDDLNTLFQSAGITQTSYGDPIAAGEIEQVRNLIYLTGPTTIKSNGLPMTEGLLNPFVTLDGPLSGDWIFKAELNIIDSTQYLASPSRGEPLFQSSSVSQYGSYLVRPAVVPVPAAVWLFISGLIGLTAVVRRR